MKFILNKKGVFDISQEVPVWLVRMLILVLVLVVLFSGIYVHISRDVKISGFESQMVAYKIISCLSNVEEDLGIIDSQNLQLIDQCIKSKDISLKLTLHYLNGDIEDYFIDQAVFNSQWPLCDKNIKNKNYDCGSLKEYVLVDGDKPAFLEFNILLKRFSG